MGPFLLCSSLLGWLRVFLRVVPQSVFFLPKPPFFLSFYICQTYIEYWKLFLPTPTSSSFPLSRHPQPVRLLHLSLCLDHCFLEVQNWHRHTGILFILHFLGIQVPTLVPLSGECSLCQVQIDTPFDTSLNAFVLSSIFSKLLTILSILFILIFSLSLSTPTLCLLASIFIRALWDSYVAVILEFPLTALLGWKSLFLGALGLLLSLFWWNAFLFS